MCRWFLTALALIVLITGVVILWRVGKQVSSPQSDDAQNTIRETLIQEALIKRTIFRAAVLYEGWWAHNNRSYLGFLENTNNASAMNSLIDDMKSKHLDAYYYTHSSKDLFVIKVRPKDNPLFYCFDSTDMNLDVEQIIVSENNYKSQTTCCGATI